MPEPLILLLLIPLAGAGIWYIHEAWVAPAPGFNTRLLLRQLGLDESWTEKVRSLLGFSGVAILTGVVVTGVGFSLWGNLAGELGHNSLPQGPDLPPVRESLISGLARLIVALAGLAYFLDALRPRDRSASLRFLDRLGVGERAGTPVLRASVIAVALVMIGYALLRS